MIIRADFHIHSCLSPCASLDMSPRTIIRGAREQGLNLIALTDHNSARNCPAIAEIAQEYDDIRCFFGMEVNTMEEAHCLALFDSLETALEFDRRVYTRLQNIPNQPEKTGDQPIVDAQENIIGIIEKYLGAATDIPLSELVHWVHLWGGLCIPSHIDRPYCSLISQLGFIPPDDYDALEISRNSPPEISPALSPSRKYPLVTNSDSHVPEDIGRAFNSFQFDGDLSSLSVEIIREKLRQNQWELRR